MALTIPYRQHNYLGEYLNDSAAEQFIIDNKWDTNNDGTGDPHNGVFYYNTTDDKFRSYINGSWDDFIKGSDHGALIGLNDDDHTIYLLINGSRPMTGDLDAGNNKIINLADGVLSTDAVNKGQLDSAVQGLDWQDSVLSGTVTDPSTLSPYVGDRYLIPTGATGVWSTHIGNIAEWDGIAWQYTVQNPGMCTTLEDEAKTVIYDGTIWRPLGGTIRHSDLIGLGNDDHLQYHTDARGDVRYFTKVSFINISTGVADAGKPIVLDSTGHIDPSMVNANGVDHGTLGGLGDDDHTIYHTDARGDIRYYTKTQLGSTTPGTEGASLIGTDTKTHLDNATNVEEALEKLNTLRPIAFKHGTGNPNSVVSGNSGDRYIDDANQMRYDNIDGTINGWIIV